MRINLHIAMYQRQRIVLNCVCLPKEENALPSYVKKIKTLQKARLTAALCTNSETTVYSATIMNLQQKCINLLNRQD